MYTKCPSCRSEISFEPPANMDSLPEGYKHRIKCPSCGVTIGVKIPKQEAAPLSFTPQNEFAKNDSYEIPTATPVEKAEEAPVAAKRTGVVRNVFMMIISLLFIAVNVLAYLLETGKLDLPEFFFGITAFDGIGVFDLLINDFELIRELYFTKETIVQAVYFLLPACIFALAGVQFIVAFIAAIGKKYSRAFNFVFSFLTAAAAFALFFGPAITQNLEILSEITFIMPEGAARLELKPFFEQILDAKAYGLFIGVGLSFVSFVLAIIGAIIPMKKKN